ncbi:hypothetical protein MIMGU_mgv1a011741mg [Erythranthe guttata]|uniref:Uncharacterized protein n=1 Tax=Erythranthe guttata TaxID=4155 RepID=A0A022Q7X8_ERYGU|nr:hypothetical protein MIMGU_mgv1a011741mg [Erythranthe guttata]
MKNPSEPLVNLLPSYPVGICRLRRQYLKWKPATPDGGVLHNHLPQTLKIARRTINISGLRHCLIILVEHVRNILIEVEVVARATRRQCRAIANLTSILHLILHLRQVTRVPVENAPPLRHHHHPLRGGREDIQSLCVRSSGPWEAVGGPANLAHLQLQVRGPRFGDCRQERVVDELEHVRVHEPVCIVHDREIGHVVHECKLYVPTALGHEVHGEHVHDEGRVRPVEKSNEFHHLALPSRVEISLGRLLDVGGQHVGEVCGRRGRVYVPVGL